MAYGAFSVYEDIKLAKKNNIDIDSIENDESEDVDDYFKRNRDAFFKIVFIKNEYCRSQTVLFKDFYEPE